MNSRNTRPASLQPALYPSRTARTSALGSIGENGMRRNRSVRGESPCQMRCSTVTVVWRQFLKTGSRGAALRISLSSEICCSMHSMARCVAGIMSASRHAACADYQSEKRSSRQGSASL